MEFYFQNVERNVLVLSADGGLDKATVPEFVGELEQAIRAGTKNILVDCTKLRYVSLAGLLTLIGLHKRLAPRGGNVKVAAIQSPIARWVSESSLSHRFHVYSSVEGAKDAFRSEAASGPMSAGAATV